MEVYILARTTTPAAFLEPTTSLLEYVTMRRSYLRIPFALGVFSTVELRESVLCSEVTKAVSRLNYLCHDQLKTAAASS